MVNIFKRLFQYNWKYYVFSISLFILFWQVFSVFSAAKVADDKLVTAMRQNAAYFEKAFLKGDVFETQRIMWRIKNESIKRITFFPVKFEGSKWIFKEAIVGNLYERPWAQQVRNIPFISNGAELGQLKYVIDLADINKAVFEENYILFIVVILFFLILLTISNMGSIRTLLAVERSMGEINKLADSGKSEFIRDSIDKHIHSLPAGPIGTPFIQMTEHMADALKHATKLESELAVSKAMSDLSAQVAHDIRSPLAALDSITKDIAQLPEEKRIIIRSAMGRIRDIANNLIEKNRQLPKDSSSKNTIVSASVEPANNYLLSSLIDPIITEKHFQFRSKTDIEIIAQLDRASYGLFAKIQPIEFKRIVSNLINNAVEAFKTESREQKAESSNKGISSEDLTKKGKVEVLITAKNDKAIIEIKDNGKGIAPEILEKLGQKGSTHGKKGGSGLGLYHAKTTIESWNGKLEIQSKQGKGTSVILTLPKAKAPDWFVSKLEVKAGSTIVTLDDDISIHHIWQGRYESIRAKEQNIEIHHFSEPNEFRQWIKNNQSIIPKTLFLLDYELSGYEETGLSLAEEMNIGEQSILVTSRYEEQRIIDNCIRIKAKMIPKGLSGMVPMEKTVVKSLVLGVESGLGYQRTTKPVAPMAPDTHQGSRKEQSSNAVKLLADSCQAILIDDDSLVIMNWKMAARKKGVTLKTFKEPKEFINNADNYSKETILYIDTELADDVKGEDIAKELNEKGFKNIYMETGHPKEQFAHLKFIKEVIGKEPPFKE